MSRSQSRSQRQVQELLDLCEHGSLSRAVDLAFEHFADFGRNEEVLDFIAAAIDCTPVPAALRRRFLDLASGSAGSQRSGARSSTSPPNERTTKGTPNVQ